MMLDERGWLEYRFVPTERLRRREQRPVCVIAVPDARKNVRKMQKKCR
jgi:hypothetical protein